MSEIRRTRKTTPDELLRTKLAPPRLHPNLVLRAALVSRLDEGLARKLTLISAPAGFGKSMLVAEWLAASHRPAAWVGLDAGDNDPARFWRYVLTACRTFDAALGKSALAALPTSQQLSFETALTPFVNELAQLPNQGVLVLEDYHLITAPEVHDSFTFLLDHLPATLHCILITRSEPALPLARWRARNELNEFGPADLRFSLDETRAFLEQTLQASLSPEAVARLDERTEGWAAGLHLVALALQGKRGEQEINQFLATFTGGHRHVLEYLAGEVFAAQPVSWQEFLLRTSFLNRLTGALCDAVTGRTDSALLLDQLERANLFLIRPSQSDSQPWYRYHGLFAEAMRRHAWQRLGEAEVRALHEKASRWYEARGLLNEAVEAALAAGQFESAAALIERFLESRGFNEIYTTRRWAEQLPQEVLRGHPLLCFGYAMALLFTSDRYAPATTALLETPLGMAETTWRGEGNDARLGQALSLRAVIAVWQGDLRRSFALSREALELLAEDDVLWRGISLINVGGEALQTGKVNVAQHLLIEARALCQAAQNIHGTLAVMSLLGEVHCWQGDFDQASQYYQEVLVKAVGGEEMLDDQGSARLGLSTIAFERNDLSAAEQQAAQALEMGQRRGDEERAAQATLILARVQHARGEKSRAQELLQAVAVRLSRPLLFREVQAWQARFWLADGDLESARQWQTAAATQSEKIPLILQELEALTVARLRIGQRQTEAALELLAGWQADARSQGRVRSELEILCLKTLAHFAQGDQALTEQSLTRALAMAQARGFRRIFLDEGEPMAAVLGAVIPKLTKRALAAYATTLLRAFAPQRTDARAARESGASPLLEPLSSQEQRVLRLLVAGMSNPEIARELVVSTNTIKTQVQSIYRKLNVGNRDQAREAAYELNLI